MKEKKKSKSQLEKEYFQEAESWDSNVVIEANKSKKIAWIIASISILMAFLAVGGIFAMLPLKTVEPFVIRVNDTNGMVDVVSVLAETDGTIKASSKELLDKHWIGKYVIGREGYHYDTRALDRRQTGLFSSITVQQEYALETDPKQNPKAPVTIYGQITEVDVKVNSISFISKDELINKERRSTVHVRFTKEIKTKGDKQPLQHWVATLSFVYRNSPMKLDDRLINPLGFQVVSYRKDQENYGVK